MKNVYVSEVDRMKVRDFNKSKAKGIHMPYITKSFMSIGTRSIFWCPFQERTVYVLSQGEKRVYVTQFFAPDVVKIEEQYPLDYETTQAIADAYGIIHPRNHQTGELNVMTTDFLVTRTTQQGDLYRVACSVKDKIDTRKTSRINQKLDIEQEYWRKFGVSYDFLLEEHICKVKADNLLRLMVDID